MNFGDGKSQFSSTSEYLVVTATFFEIVRILKRVIRESFLDTPHQAENTGYTILEPKQ